MFFNQIYQVVDGNQFRATEVDGISKCTLGEQLTAIYAIVDEHERSGLFSVTPYVDLVLASQDRGGDLSGDRCRCFLPSTVPGALWPIHVVIPSYTCLKAKVVAEVSAHALGEELLPSIPILRHSGVSVCFFEGPDIAIQLFVCRIHASGGRVEVSTNL